MKELYKIRRHIEKDLINRLIKSNRKLDFQRLWHQFSKRTLSKGIDREMYRAYLEQKVMEGKLVFKKSIDEYCLADDISRENFQLKKTEEKGYWKELEDLISRFKKNHTEHQKYFQLDAEQREKHFDVIKELKVKNDHILLEISVLCKKNEIGINFLKKQLPILSFQQLAVYYEQN